jgi:hypothetical protein
MRDMKTRFERTTEILRADKIPYEKVEYRHHITRTLIDLFHIVDILVLDGGFLGIQVCGDDLQPHIKKLTQEYRNNSLNWLNNRGRLEIHSWSKRKMFRGSKRMIWKCRIVDILLINNQLVTEERK